MQKVYRAARYSSHWFGLRCVRDVRDQHRICTGCRAKSRTHIVGDVLPEDTRFVYDCRQWTLKKLFFGQYYCVYVL